MYQNFFAFRERPFKLVPNPEYFYMSQSHEEALAHLTYAISQGDGFVVIDGEVGTGKTTLCRVFLEGLDENTESAYIFNPKLGPKQMLMTIAEEFGLSPAADTTKDIIDTLNSYLMAKKAEGKKVVLLIDEAQNLAPNVLELLRLLSNLETSKFKLLQIILVGQPELIDMLDSHELRQLGQRITLKCHLKPLSFKEVKEYIEHRIHIASKRAVAQFTLAAYRAINKYSAGIPRLINIVCDRALLTAYGLNQKKITGNTTKAAILELAGRSDFKGFHLHGRRKAAVILSTFCLAVLMIILYLSGTIDLGKFIQRSNLKAPIIVDSNLPAPAEPMPAEADSKPVQPQRITARELETALDLADFLQDFDVLASRRLALKEILTLWQTDARIAPALDSLEDDYAFIRLSAEQNGLLAKRFGCNFTLIKRLNLPALLAISMPEWQTPGYLTIRKIDQGKITLHNAEKDDLIEVTLDILERHCSGAIYILWKNFFVYKGTIPKTAPEESIIVLKMHLQDIGFNDIEISPFYDEPTKKAVRQIQRKHGLRPDGIVGPLTKIVLYNEKKSLKIPHLVN
jgi:general secretion pathway protein A